ncbi:selenocysteine-specific translation elongation factor [Gallibacterium trehalosifermentans]|uniref:Selenocysteine-specific elongation factor n=1 Tax=Gallibacterium trehalosifermentans TaxID=516935 RepID=A0ABV6GZ82_9PAST
MIIVTAGHVDHGKTALLAALTGTNADRLPEEKKRGMTIDLGYAYLPLNGRTLGFIDVPGHQKFLANMLAGLGGIEHALLVVSAEEGIKPQTTEHLQILQLLKFRQIMVVITKADRATDAQITKLIEEIKQRYPFLHRQDFFITSAQTGQGIDVLKAHLAQLSSETTLAEKPFRYAIDRIFTLKGIGVVVTGTAVAGKVAVGDTLYLTNGEKVRVKRIHAQNSESEQGVAGERLALNLAGVDKSDISRGDWLSELAPDFACERFTVLLHPCQPLKETTQVHLYHYASHVTAKVSVLNAKQAVENQPYFAEIVLDTPLHLALGDKLILRSGDDQHTLAGAQVLEIASPKRYKRSETRLSYLHALSQASEMAMRVQVMLEKQAIFVPPLLWAEQCYPADVNALQPRLACEQVGDYLFNRTYKQTMQARILAKITEFHAEHHDQMGVTKARLYRMAVLDAPQSLMFALIDELIAQQQLAQTRGWIHAPSHRIAFDDDELHLWAQVEPLFKATNQALWVRDIAQQLAVEESAMRNLLYKAGKLGYLVPIVKDRFLLDEQMREFAHDIHAFIQENGAISVNQLRDHLQYGRKLTVQLIEYFDRSGFLRRKGNVHLLRDHGTFS